MKQSHLAVAAAFALSSIAAAQNNPWTVGEPLPELKLPTIDGGTLSLSELRGKRIVLIEFASW